MTKRAVTEPNRCGWNTEDPLFITYHDFEWGIPLYDSLKLFEMLCLAGQQAGISWRIILKKRDNYRKAFYDFDPIKISEMTNEDVNELLQNQGILRNKGKINSIINNAKCFNSMEANGENFSEFIWSFVDHKPVINNWKCLTDIPTQSPISIKMAKDLKKKKFSYIGSTICYAFMQSCGLINDHLVGCSFRNIGVKRKKTR